MAIASLYETAFSESLLNQAPSTDDPSVQSQGRSQFERALASRPDRALVVAIHAIHEAAEPENRVVVVPNAQPLNRIYARSLCWVPAVITGLVIAGFGILRKLDII